MSTALYNRTMVEIKNALKLLYNDDYQDAMIDIEALIAKHGTDPNAAKSAFKNNEAFLFAPANALNDGEAKPLYNLLDFMGQRCAGLFTTLHILPFCESVYENSTAVVDYNNVDPALGDFEAFGKYNGAFKLMADLEIAHVSNKSDWLKNYLNDVEGYNNLFMPMWPDFDYSDVYSDGHEPFFSRYHKPRQGKNALLLSTYGEDLVDLNYGDYRTLVRMLKVILFYVSRNFSGLRLLDAEYIWKDPVYIWDGHIKGHTVLKIIRMVLDVIDPDIRLAIASPKKRGAALNYFGSGRDEVQLIYNESLPAMLLHALLSGNARPLSTWAASLQTGSTFTSLLNITASYNDIDLKPLEGFLSMAAIEGLARHAQENGGEVSYYTREDGTSAPEKLNIGYFDVLSLKGDTPEMTARRFIAGQAVQAVMPGIPAVYLYSLVGARGYTEPRPQNQPASVLCNHNSINTGALLAELNDENSTAAKIFNAYAGLLEIRHRQPAFNPRSGFEVIMLDYSVFILKRFALQQTIWTFTNTSAGYRTVSLDSLGYFTEFRDILTGREFLSSHIELRPYEFLWLEPLK